MLGQKYKRRGKASGPGLRPKELSVRNRQRGAEAGGRSRFSPDTSERSIRWPPYHPGLSLFTAAVAMKAPVFSHTCPHLLPHSRIGSLRVSLHRAQAPLPIGLAPTQQPFLNKGFLTDQAQKATLRPAPILSRGS